MPEEKVGRGKQPQDRAALEATLLNRSGVMIPAKDWSAFKAWIERPAEAIGTHGTRPARQLSHLISAPKKALRIKALILVRKS